MSETRTCPVCGNPVEADSHECSKCGFKLVGRTEELGEPIRDAAEIADVALHCGKAHLTITKGPLEGEVFYLESMPISIGRDPNCDLFLNNMTVSRCHAVIERHGNKILVKDGKSLNGTWVDGTIVDEAELQEGTLLQIGTFAMRFSCA
ncbi:MAG: FHA domain-containing protein [Coriobacteriales bacterium]|jgi:hypothetical protein|nr:FHA domain-containing protein [Coriobacteriales bacterium]